MPTRKSTRRVTRKGYSPSRSTSRGRGVKGASGKRSTGRGSSARGINRGGLKSGEPTHRQYSKWIDSPDDHEDRQGQSLATRNHDVILQWAHLRKALPSVVGDTERRDGVGVLRIDFPGYRGKRLKKVGWDRWFDMFDKRKLVFLYQEHKEDGSRGTFFKLTS